MGISTRGRTVLRMRDEVKFVADYRTFKLIWEHFKPIQESL